MPRTTLTRYALAPDGRLVYRDNGNVVRGNLTTRQYPNGRIGVYDSRGRFKGYVGKPNQAIQQRINRNAKRRVRDAEMRSASVLSDRADRQVIHQVQRETWQGYLNRGREWRANMASGRPDFVPVRIQERYNFAEILDKAVDQGIMTDERASELFNQYLESETRTERTQMWRDFDRYFEDMGFEYESGEFKAKINNRGGADGVNTGVSQSTVGGVRS